MNRIGIDVGSKTIKIAVIDEAGQLVHSVYRNHRSNIQKTLVDVIEEYRKRYGNVEGHAAVTGSGGISVARMLGLPFVQEVVATTFAVQHAIPQANIIIELGGEDAKVVYLDDPIEQRMNATCAGGTGGFIDSIAALLGVHTGEMNMLAIRARHTYPLASRCAVFAQTDVRPLLNVGITKEDIAASALEAVVKQTVGGLACGRPIRGNVVFLGGPFQYIPHLYTRFCRALGLTGKTGIRPEKAHLYTARGAAIEAGNVAAKEAAAGAPAASNLTSLTRISALAAGNSLQEEGLGRIAPLFGSEQERAEFDWRHAAEKMERTPAHEVRGPLYVGIDAGASSVKIAAVDEQGRIAATLSRPACGDALTVAARMLETLYELLPKGSLAYLSQTVATGSGDETIQHALRADSSVVETTAHLRAAQQFAPEASFVLDAGGQDMKALWVKDGEVSDAILNEPCSSGCGTFMEETARALQCTPAAFSDLALRATAPVELDTKCIVFMNSRVRHAQKIGASSSDIAAGLAYSVAQNAYQRVIGRAGHADFGPVAVVQGGLFKSDAVLRAFEKVSGLTVRRPDTAEHMGAIGAALVARDRAAARRADLDEQGRGGEPVKSAIASPAELACFDPVYSTYSCTGCEDACILSIVSYGKNSIYLSGNRCMKGADIVKEESLKLSAHDILGASSMLPRSKGALRSRHHSEVGNGIVIPGYLRTFGGGLNGGGGTQGISEAPRRVDYYANQLEKDRTRPRTIKIVPTTKYLSAEEVARKQQEEAKSEQQREAEARQREQEYREKLNIQVKASSRTLRSEEIAVPNLAAVECALLAEFTDAPGTGSRARTTIGIVNTLGTFDQMPFWHTLFSSLGYGVAVPHADRVNDFAIIGAESIPSESVCDAAKASHARMYEMADRGANALFMPHVERNGRCAVLCGYADAVAGNVPFIQNGAVAMISPLLESLQVEGLSARTGDVTQLRRALEDASGPDAPAEEELRCALDRAAEAQRAFAARLGKETRRALEWIAASPDRYGILLAGRPYHVDPDLSHGIDAMLGRMGYAVLTPRGVEALQGIAPAEEAGADAGAGAWPPADRLLAMVDFALGQQQVDVVLLQSFNCGYDAVSMEDARLALMAAHRPFAVIKIDEMADRAHVDVRLRTLAESIEAGKRERAARPATGGRAQAHDAAKAADSAADSKASDPAAFEPLDVLADGIQRADIDRAHTTVAPDVCFTAASIISHALGKLRANPDAGELHLPVTCKSCLVDALPHLVERACGRPVDVVWDGAWQPDRSRPAQDSPVQSAQPTASGVRIGIVGNPLLCYDAFMNENIVALLESLGAQAVLPEPRSLQVDDVRYLEQLEQFSNDGVDSVLYLQNPGCLKAHVQARGALHEFQRKYPSMPVTVLDYDPESSALNRENRIRLVVSAAEQKRAQRAARG